jgi:hypothetical protein
MNHRQYIRLFTINGVFIKEKQNMDTKGMFKQDILTKSMRPEEDIERLINSVENKGKFVTIAKRRHINLAPRNEPHCLVLLKGSMALCRINDGIVINSECAPFIFGANTRLAYSQHIYVRAKETSELFLVPRSVFYDEVARLNLWQSLATLQDYTSAKVYAHCLTVSQLSSYDIIRTHLLRLMEEPEAVRGNITAANYILDHSFLSRSGVMKILAQLKKEECVHLSRGVLINITDLPEKLTMFYSKPKSRHDNK